MRIVLDTNVLARAHQNSQGPARRILQRVISGTDVLISSTYIFSELERVLTYPRVLKKSGLSLMEIAEYLESLARIACLVTPVSVPASFLRDATDEAILGTALAGRAEVLCTRDADLLEWKVREFCSEAGIRVLTDLEYLETHRS